MHEKVIDMGHGQRVLGGFAAACVTVATLVAGSDLVVRLSGVDRGYWVPLTALVVLRPDFATTFQRASMRVVGTIAELVYTGPATRYIVEGEHGLRIIAERHNDHAPTDTAPWSRGDRVRAVWATEHAAVVP